MAYCTTSDVRLLTNILSGDISDTVLTDLIACADTYCDTQLHDAGIVIPLPSPIPSTLKLASANLAAALCLNRKRVDLSRPQNLNLTDLSFGTSPDSEILYFETAGRRYLSAFISECTGSSGTRIEVVEGE